MANPEENKDSIEWLKANLPEYIEHNRMSPETRENINNLTTSMKQLEEHNRKISEKVVKIETIVETMKEQNDKDHARLAGIVEDFIKGAPTKFASKLTEKIVYTMAGTILTAVLVALISLIVMR